MSSFAQRRWCELVILGAANERSSDGADQLGPLLARQPFAIILVERAIGKRLERLRVGSDPAAGRVVEQLRGDALVDNVEILRQAQQGRALAQNIMRQAVQRAHAITHVGKQGRAILLALRRSERRRFQEAANAPREVVHSGVGESDDQHLFLVANALAHELGREVGQDRGLAAAGHRRDTQIAAGIEEDQGFSLIRTRKKGHR